MAGWRADRTPGPRRTLALTLALVGATFRGGDAAEAPAAGGASGGPLPWLPVVDEGCPADRFVDVPEVYGVTEGRTRQGGCHCHYVDIADLDEATFTEKYNSKRIPLVITGALKHWRALEEWTPAFFSTGVWKDVEIVGTALEQNTLDLEEKDSPCTLATRMHAWAKGDGGRGKRPQDLVRFMPECEAWVAARRERFEVGVEKLEERGGLPATYAEFIEWIFDKEKEEDVYGHYIKLDKQFSQDHPELIEEYAPLTGPGAIPDWLQLTKPGQDLSREEDGTLAKHFPIQGDWHIPAWLIGATGSRTTPHLDGTGWTSWIAVIKGKKLIHLWHNEADYNATVAGKDLDKERADLEDFHMYALDPFDKLPPPIKKNWARSGRSYLDQHWDPDARTAFRGNGGDPLPPMAPAQCVLKDGDLLITMDTIHSALNLEPGIALTGNALDVYALAQFIWRGWLHKPASPVEGSPLNPYYQLYLRMCRRESTRAFKPKVLRGIRERARNARAARSEWVRYKYARARGRLERDWADFKDKDFQAGFSAYRELTEEDFGHLADLQEAYRGEGGDDHGEEL